jgi:selenocysteine lyase/cysteine desulfurase
MRTVETLEAYFSPYRANIIGNSQVFDSPFGKQRMVYADWTASGRAYQPIESFIQKEVLPFAGNTHTGSTITGTLMSDAYEKAKIVIKQHINAGADDALLFCGSGMTSAVNKLQRLLGLKIAGRLKDYGYNPASLDEDLRPVVFVSHMEHHSNHTSWLETIATVEVIPPSKEGNIDLEYFAALLERYKHRKNKIAAITACSNVTGIETPYHEVARLIHRYGGLCFVDFACSAPYVAIDMHPKEKDAQLDAIYFSMHKFLGGPGTPGVLVFNKSLYKNQVPDQPGGGTVTYSNPWGGRRYINDIESREDGGTPPFLQAIKAAMCIRLKERMGIENIRMREAGIVEMILDRLALMKNVEVLAPNNRDRLGVVSFTVAGAHYNLIVKLLNDRFGIQMRGGCSCAGTYGHYLLEVDEEWSERVLNAIIAGDTSQKPGWVRLSVHAIMPDDEITFILDAIEATATHFSEWAEDYRYDSKTNEFIFKGSASGPLLKGDEWFDSWRWDKVIPQAVNLNNHENATLVSAVG